MLVCFIEKNGVENFHSLVMAWLQLELHLAHDHVQVSVIWYRATWKILAYIVKYDHCVPLKVYFYEPPMAQKIRSEPHMFQLRRSAI